MPRILREKLIDHLKRISCGGQVKEVIFADAFAANALTPDHLLLVVAPELDGMKSSLSTEIGIGDLKKLISALGFLGGDGDEQADVSVELRDHRLVIDEGSRNALIKLVTANPKTIATRVQQETVDRLLDKIEQSDAGTVALSVDLLDDVQKAYVGLKADTVKLIVGPSGGFVKVGTDNSDGAEFCSPALVASEERTLNFGEHLIKVFETVSGDVVLYLPGKNSSTIAIEDEGFTYLVSAKAQESSGKPQVKPDAAPQAQAGEAQPLAEAPKRSRRRSAAPAQQA